MDLNYLYHREQVSLMRADAAGCTASRISHLGLARGYAELIRRTRAGDDLAIDMEGQPA